MPWSRLGIIGVGGIDGLGFRIVLPFSCKKATCAHVRTYWSKAGSHCHDLTRPQIAYLMGYWLLADYRAHLIDCHVPLLA